MKTRVHLISLPWAPADSPSIQIGVLKAFLLKKLPTNRNFEVVNYHAHLSIALSVLRSFKYSSFRCLFDDVGGRFSENPFYIALLKHFYFKRGGIGEIQKFLSATNKSILRLNSNRKGGALTLAQVRSLERALVDFIESSIRPNLISDGVNLICFSLQFWQVFSSFFVAKYLDENFPNVLTLNVFGGASTLDSKLHLLANKYAITGLVVLGDGEIPLLNIVEKTLSFNDDDLRLLKDNITEKSNYVYDLESERKKYVYSYSRQGIGKKHSSRPFFVAPDYSEYFDLLRSFFKTKKTYYRFIFNNVRIPFEGGRGCPYKQCSFCNYNVSHNTYRKKPVKNIMHEVASYLEDYCASQFICVDTMSNAWIKDFCKASQKIGMKTPALIGLRACNNESLWERISRAGFTTVFVGIEALSDKLLLEMNKGTNTFLNLLTARHVLDSKLLLMSNLITHHPRSDESDVVETIRVLNHIPHFPSFARSQYCLCIDSPDYLRLTQSERADYDKKRMAFYLGDLKRQPYPRSLFGTTYPEIPSLNKLWDDFCRWHDSWKRSKVKQVQSLEMAPIGSSAIRIIDQRKGGFKKYIFDGDWAIAYKYCHRGLSAKRIHEISEISQSTLRSAINYFVNSKLVIRIGDFYLGLALLGDGNG